MGKSIYMNGNHQSMFHCLFSFQKSPLYNFFSLFQRHRKDVSNFDRQFTSETVDLTPTDKLFMMNMEQNDFAGFSYLNPEFIQHV